MRNLKELTSKWYQILKDDGFVDIEENFQFHSSHFARLAKRPSINSKEYFERASEFLERYEFDSDLEESIWRLHCSGIPVRTISQKLNLSLGSTHREIDRIRNIMLEIIL